MKSKPMIFFFIFALFVGIAITISAVESTFVLENQRGTVTLSHEAHTGHANDDCGGCHHDNPDNPATCSESACHLDGGDAPSRKDALHSNCKDSCHVPQNVGPTRCNDCHVR
jgi:hypothetical protein